MRQILFEMSEEEFRSLLQPYVITLSHIDTLCSHLDILDENAAYYVKYHQVDCAKTLLLDLFGKLLDKVSLPGEKSVEYNNYPGCDGISIWCDDKYVSIGDLNINDKIYEKSMDLFNKFISEIPNLKEKK